MPPEKGNDTVVSDNSPVNIFGGDNDWGDEPDVVTPTEDPGTDFDSDEPLSVDLKTDDVDDDAADPVDDDADSDAPESDDSDEPEADAEGEEEPEDDEESDDDEEEEKPSKDLSNKRVPLSRLNKEVAKRKALEAKLKAVEAKERAMADPEQETPKPKVSDIQIDKDEFKSLQEAMIDGETDQALDVFTKMMKKVHQAALEDARAQAEEVADGTYQNNRVTEKLQKRGDEIVKRFPELDHKSELADPDMIEEVLTLRNSYYELGYDPIEALDKAARLVAKDYELEDRLAAAETPKERKPKVKPVDVKRKMELAAKEKGKLPGSRTRTEEQSLNIYQLTDEQFDDLSKNDKEQLRKARGDFI